MLSAADWCQLLHGSTLTEQHVIDRNCLCLLIIMSCLQWLSATARIHPSFPQCRKSKKGKGMVLYSAVSSPLDRSKRFTLSSPGRPVHSDTVLGFSWKHSSHAAIAQRLFNHIFTTVYSQVLIYTAESTEAS